jgi:hypothetical protein
MVGFQPRLGYEIRTQIPTFLRMAFRGVTRLFTPGLLDVETGLHGEQAAVKM